MIEKLKKHWWKYIAQGFLIAVGIALVVPLADFLPLGIKIGSINLSAWYVLVAGAIAFLVDYLMNDVFNIPLPK
jgi:hypothetical protein